MKALTGARASYVRTASILLAVFVFVTTATVAQDTKHSELEPQQPAAVHVDDEVFADALESFHKLLNAIDIGVSYVDYRQVLVDAKTDLDSPLANFPKSGQREELSDAMQDFIIASDVWSISIDNAVWCANQYQSTGVPMKTDFYRNLRTRYGENVLPAPKLGRCARQEVLLRFIWAVAVKRIERAANLQKETRP